MRSECVMDIEYCITSNNVVRLQDQEVLFLFLFFFFFENIVRTFFYLDIF